MWKNDIQEKNILRFNNEFSLLTSSDVIFRLHQQEKAHILTMANSMVTRITEISAREKIINSCKLSRPESMNDDSLIDNMELILNRFNDMKNEM